MATPKMVASMSVGLRKPARLAMDSGAGTPLPRASTSRTTAQRKASTRRDSAATSSACCTNSPSEQPAAPAAASSMAAPSASSASVMARASSTMATLIPITAPGLTPETPVSGHGSF